MEGSDLALEELKIVQEIVARQERARTTVRNWMVTLQAGLAVAYLSDQIVFSAPAYVLVAATILVVFLLLEALYSVAERRALERGNKIEGYLRSVSSFDGPHISDSLVVGVRGGSSISQEIVLLVKEVVTPRILFGYVVLAGLVLVVGVAGS